ncbi:MAG: UvrD-helicase domain-containing protein [Planctomycetia bacterium]|nr:UvrD-helicase domain-containing protein [Planctomycetia bacterium]
MHTLTEPQYYAVTHHEGPMLIIAGPGSGKTRVITHRIAWMLRNGVDPEEILTLTFTNKAAEELQTRISYMLQPEPALKSSTSRLWISTYHRFAARLLRHYASYVGLSGNFTIYDKQDSQSALKKALEHYRQTAKEHLVGNFSLNTLASAISTAKSHLLTPDEYTPHYSEPCSALIQEIYPAYQESLRLANAVDFDDLLLLTVQLFKTYPEIRAALDAQYRYILVDEYQDINLAQYAITRALSTDIQNLTVTGDPDQSIYGWRGADISNILEFEHDFPQSEIVHLDQNYRSTQAILRAATALITRNTQRMENHLFTENPPGTPVRLTRYTSSEEEAAKIADEISEAIRLGHRKPSDFAIFYRVNSLCVEFEKALRLRGIPYQVLHGMELFSRSDVRNMLAYLRLLNNPHDNEAFLQIVNVPARGIGKISLQHLNNYAWRHGLSLWEAAAKVDDCPELKNRAKTAISSFIFAIHQMHEIFVRLQNESCGKMTELIHAVIQFSGYDSLLQELSSEDSSSSHPIQELLSLAAQFDTQNSYRERTSENTSSDFFLERFLEQTSLCGETDQMDSGDHVHLMTLHASKGLEFPVVYLTAVEHGLLPHQRGDNDPSQIEEERRLMFVGMTRAREELSLSFAGQRTQNGRTRIAAASQFLLELPPDILHMNTETLAALTSKSEILPDDETYFSQECPLSDFEISPEDASDLYDSSLKEPLPDHSFYPDISPPDDAFFSDDIPAKRKKTEKKKQIPNHPAIMTAADLLKKKNQE